MQIEAGDEIVEVDGLPVNITTLVHAMKGPPGSVVKIKLEKWQTGRLIEVSLIRQRLFQHGQQTTTTGISQQWKELDKTKMEHMDQFVLGVASQFTNLENQLASWKLRAEESESKLRETTEKFNAAREARRSSSNFSSVSGGAGGSNLQLLELQERINELEAELHEVSSERDGLSAEAVQLKAQNRQELRTMAKAEIERVRVDYRDHVDRLEQHLSEERERSSTAEGWESGRS